jgi:iron-containing alcohol dehydrogenase-like protein
LSAVTFELAAPPRIVFRAGCARDVGALAAELGRSALLVTGKSAGRARVVLEPLEAAGVRVAVLSVAGEPTLDTVRAGVATGRAASVDIVIAFGGGSALDAGKAIAALLANGGDPLDYLEVVGGGRPLTRRSVPFIAIPTTAGTGSEVTKNAVLASPAHGVKASLRSPLMLATAALVDPDLLAGVPAETMAASGLDALSQLIEPFVSVRANPVTGSRAKAFVDRRARSSARTRRLEAGLQSRLPIGRLWRWRACSAGSPWRMPGSGRCTGWRPRSGACSTRLTAPSAPPCCCPSWRRTWPRSARATPRARRSPATARRRRCSPAARRRTSRPGSSGWLRSGGRWTSLGSRGTACAIGMSIHSSATRAARAA